MPDAPLRIVHVIRAPVGGAFRHVGDLARAQAAAGHAVGVLCDSTSGGAFENAAVERLAPDLQLGVIRLSMSRQISPKDILALRGVLGHVGKLEPDVVHGHGAKGGTYGRLIGTWLGRRRPVARLYAPHGGSLHFDPRSKAGRVYFAVERLFERMTDAIIHVSAYEARIYREKVGTPRCRAVVIHNGLRPDEFVPVTPADGARDLLFLGEMRELKGVDVLLEAIARLRADGLQATATLVGGGAERERFEALASSLGIAGQVQFRSPMPAREAFTLGRTMVVPSRAESLPYVVLEAVGAGLPVVATRVGGIPEIFGPRSDALVPPADSEALAAALRRLLDDPPAAGREAVAQMDYVRPRFDLARMADETMRLYRAILAGKARRDTRS